MIFLTHKRGRGEFIRLGRINPPLHTGFNEDFISNTLLDQILSYQSDLGNLQFAQQGKDVNNILVLNCCITLTTTGKAGLTALYCCKVVSNCSMVTGKVSRKMVPSAVTVIALVWGLDKLGVLLALGKLTCTP